MIPPNRHKMALLTWVIVYPMITLLLAALDPFLNGVAMPLRTLALTLIMVPALVYVALPFATGRLQGWLKQTAAPATEDLEKNNG